MATSTFALAPVRSASTPVTTPAVEVAALFGDSVVDVRHVTDPQHGTLTRTSWAVLASGAVCLVASALAVGSAVQTATRNDEALQHHVAVLKKPAYAFRPVAIRTGTSAVAFGGLALAIAGLTLGLARSRRERRRPYYRIGTVPGVAFATESAPAADFPLVAPRGAGFIVNLGEGMTGEITAGGITTPLAAYLAETPAMPSADVGGAMELPIPLHARIRVRAGKSTFLITGVAKPAAQVTPMLANLDHRLLAYAAASLAVHIGALALLQGLPVEASGMALDLAATESITVQTSSSEREALMPEPETSETGAAAASTAGSSMTLLTRAAGRPTDADGEARVQIARRSDTPALSREEAVAQATSAGTLGSVRAIEAAITSVTGTSPLTSGFDTQNVWGGLQGRDGSQRGTFGVALDSDGHGAGCSYGVCDGIARSTARYQTIGDGPRAGDPYGKGPGGDGPLRRRTSTTPPPRLGDAACPGGVCGIDKATIRRYIQRSLPKLQYCYEHELMANHALDGTVTATFVIGMDGSVMGSRATGVSAEVAQCVAGVIGSIKFPRPGEGGVVQVNYPIGFRFAR